MSNEGLRGGGALRHACVRPVHARRTPVSAVRAGTMGRGSPSSGGIPRRQHAGGQSDHGPTRAGAHPARPRRSCGRAHRHRARRRGSARVDGRAPQVPGARRARVRAGGDGRTRSRSRSVLEIAAFRQATSSEVAFAGTAHVPWTWEQVGLIDDMLAVMTRAAGLARRTGATGSPRDLRGVKWSAANEQVGDPRRPTSTVESARRQCMKPEAGQCGAARLADCVTDADVEQPVLLVRSTRLGRRGAV